MSGQMSLAPDVLSEYPTDLVDSEPSLHTVSIPLEAQLGVRDEISDQLHRIACSEAAISLVQSKWRIVVMKSDGWFDASGDQTIDLSCDQPIVRPYNASCIHCSNDHNSPNHRSTSVPSHSPDHPHHLSPSQQTTLKTLTNIKNDERTKRLNPRPRDRKPVGLGSSLLQQLDVLLPQIVRATSVFTGIRRSLQELVPVARTSTIFLCTAFDLICGRAGEMLVVKAKVC
jgi:hypothetical protein